MRICAECFKSDEWKNKFNLQASKNIGTCDFCGETHTTVDFENCFKPYLLKLLTIFKNDRNGKPISKILTEDFGIFANEQIAKIVLRVLATDVDSSLKLTAKCCYKDEILAARNLWENVKRRVVNEFRFFTSIDLTEEGWDAYFGQDRYTPIKNGSIFYRGRPNDNAKRPFKKPSDLGMPPAEKATAGRVNPHGIPCLYLTEQPDTTIYELRATFGDKISVGKFEVLKDLNVIDFNYRPLLTNSIDNDSLEDDIKEFLLKQQIGADLSKPMRRYDNKEIEYVPTQYICEFIKILGADGIRYNSAVHHNGRNLVLFKSDKVRCVSVDVKTVGEPTMGFVE